MSNDEVNVQKVYDNEGVIVNTIANKMNALVFGRLAEAGDFAVSHVNVSEKYLDLPASWASGTWEVQLSVPSVKSEPMFGIGFHFNKEEVLTSEEINFEISDSSVDNSAPEENFGYWYGVAWDWNTTDVHQEFVTVLSEKLDAFLQRVQEHEEDAGEAEVSSRGEN